ncbi:MAG: DUF4334 domain-containing protein [bacterium]
MKKNRNFEQFLKQGKISCGELDNFFAELEPIEIDELIGKWRGGYFRTGKSKVEFFLKNFIIFKWHGKNFLSADNVKALVFSFLGIKFNLPLGTARLRKVEYRDKFSISMIYNYFPIIDNFRKVDDNTIMGIMDIKGKTGVYFYLRMQK